MTLDNVEPKKLKILMCGPHLKATSGISNVVNNWIDAGIGGHVDLCYVSTLRHYVPGRIAAKTMNAIAAYWNVLIKLFASFDILHLHVSSGMSFVRKWILFKLAGYSRIKRVIHIHGSNFDEYYDSSPSWLQRLIRNSFNNADAVLVLSEKWKEFVNRISSNRNVYILYNGSNLSIYSGKIDHGDRINISCMGRLGKRKGTYDLLEAFLNVCRENPDAHLVLGGDGDVEEVRKIIQDQDVGDRAHLLGWVTGDDKIRVFKECDIYVLPSYNEGLPGSILEAMAVGVPIVSTPVGGIPEAVIEGRNGYLVEPGDREKLFDRIMLLCRDEESRRRMGRESRKIIEEKFDIYKIVDSLVGIYRKVAVP